MENQKIIDTDKNNKYLISVSEDYFYQTYFNWNKMTGDERMNIRNVFIKQIEEFLLGNISNGICEMRFIDKNQNLSQVVTITPVENKCSLFQGVLNEAHSKCFECGKEEWQHK